MPLLCSFPSPYSVILLRFFVSTWVYWYSREGKGKGDPLFLLKSQNYILKENLIIDFTPGIENVCSRAPYPTHGRKGGVHKGYHAMITHGFKFRDHYSFYNLYFRLDVTSEWPPSCNYAFNCTNSNSNAFKISRLGGIYS